MTRQEEKGSGGRANRIHRPCSAVVLVWCDKWDRDKCEFSSLFFLGTNIIHLFELSSSPSLALFCLLPPSSFFFLRSQRIRDTGGFVVMGRTLGKLAVARALGDFEFKDKASPLLKEYVLPPIHPYSATHYPVPPHLCNCLPLRASIS